METLSTWVWLRLVVYSIAALIVITPASGAVYQQILLGNERRAHPMPGELVDVGGYKMHIYCAGQGYPAIIKEFGESRTVADKSLTDVRP